MSESRGIKAQLEREYQERCEEVAAMVPPIGCIYLPLAGAQGKDRVAVIDSVDSYLAQYRWHVSFRHKPYVNSSVKRDGQLIVLNLHREVLHAKPGEHVDHINGDSLDNRRENLRIVTHAQNMLNKVKRPGTISSYKGVTPDKRTGRWKAQISAHNRKIYIGVFATEIEAAQAYDAASLEHHGIYGRRNFS